MPVVYALFNLKNDEIFYIGCTRGNPEYRLSSHKWQCRKGINPVNVYVRKYKIKFGMKILEEFTNNCDIFKLKREDYWIKKLEKEGVDLKNKIGMVSKLIKKEPKKSINVQLEALLLAKKICVYRNWSLSEYVTEAIIQKNKRYPTTKVVNI